MVKRGVSKGTENEKITRQKKKKPYLEPRLIKYGHMEKLTETGGTRRNDSGPRTQA